jgi:hypothetical protein
MDKECMRGVDYYCIGKTSKIYVCCLHPLESQALLNQIEGRATRGKAEGKVYVFNSAHCLNTSMIAK